MIRTTNREQPTSPVPGRGEPADEIRLGDCLLDLGAQHLLRCDSVIPLDPKAISVLLHLAEAAPHFVSSETLLARTWEGTIVGDNALQQVIRRLREAFGDDARSPRFIATLHRRGYRLLVTPEVAGLDRPSSPGTSPPRHLAVRTFAILPFVDRSVGTIDPYLSEGLTLEIGSQLSKVSAIHLISRTAVAAALAKATTPLEVGTDLGAECVLEGTIRTECSRVRVTVQLNDVATGEQLWSATFDRDSSNLLALHSQIAFAVVQSLGIRAEERKRLDVESIRSLFARVIH